MAGYDGAMRNIEFDYSSDRRGEIEGKLALHVYGVWNRVVASRLLAQPYAVVEGGSTTRVV